MNNSIVHFQVNLTFILISCSIELVNNSLTLVCFSMIFVICIHPWPFKLAQVYLITFNALGFIICALGATISCLQILFVIKFSLVFSGNPLKIGRVILLAVCFVTGIPNLICGLFVITQGIPMGPTVYFLSQTQIKQNSQSISFFINHPRPFGPFFVFVSSFWHSLLFPWLWTSSFSC